MCWSRIWELLNNASLAAAIGAFLAAVAAVVTVFITDSIRGHGRARKRLPALLTRQRNLARNRRAEVQELLVAGRFGVPSPPPFSVDVLLRLAESVAGYLNDREQQGIDNIAYLMRQAEELTNAANAHFKQSVQASPSGPIPTIFNLVHQANTEAVSILSRLELLIDAYLAGALNEFGSLDASPPS